MPKNPLANIIEKEISELTDLREGKRKSLRLRDVIEHPFAAIYGDLAESFGLGAFSHNYPTFAPSLRKSPRRRESQRPVGAMAHHVAEGLWLSLNSVWQFYQGRGMAKSALLDAPFCEKSLISFLAPLDEIFQNESETYEWLDYMSSCESLPRLDRLWFDLPFIHWDNEESFFWEALFSSPESFGAMLATLFEESEEVGFGCLEDKDCSLVEKIGLPKLGEVYAESGCDKLLDLKKFSQWPGFFAKTQERFPELIEQHCPITIGEAPTDVYFENAEHIEFALSYTRDFFACLEAAPRPWRIIENENNAAVDLVEDMCRVYREQKKKTREGKNAQKEKADACRHAA